MKHAAMGFSSVAFPLSLLLAGIVAAQSAPPKLKPSVEPIYVITAHTVGVSKRTHLDVDFYTITYGSLVLKLEFDKSVDSQYYQLNSNVSQMPQVGVPIRACKMTTDFPGFEGRPFVATQLTNDPCIARNGDMLQYNVAPNGGKHGYECATFDILEETNNVGVAAVQSAPPRKDIPAIAKAANGAIVSIVMSGKDGKPIAQGSGFLISNDGVIMTNYHVIAEGSSAVVKFPDGAFHVVDGVLASDKARDVAVIKAHGENFRTLTLGNSDQLQVGEEVIAIGNPLSLESTVSNGIVSGIRSVEEEGGKYLQITAPISPGSSGGPLFNMAGEVIGITTLYLKGGENLNFAIPINDAKHLILAKSSKIQALPNETEPVQAQTHDGGTPSSVASPSARSTPVEEQVACRAQADRALQEEIKRWSTPPGVFNVISATDSSRIDPLGTGVCFVLIDVAANVVKPINGKTDSIASLDVRDAIGGTVYAEYFVDTVDNVPEIACSVKRPGWSTAARVCTTGEEFMRLINTLFGL